MISIISYHIATIYLLPPMPGILFNQPLIANLNQLKDIPVPITKFIIDEIIEHLKGTSEMNENQLAKILKNEKVDSCDWRKGINSIKFLIKLFVCDCRFCLKEKYAMKKVGLFVAEDTLLSQEIAEYLCVKYEELANAEDIAPPHLAQLADVSWGAYNLRQDISGSTINKMYMKTRITTLEEGRQSNKVIISTLPEFKLIINQVREAGSALR